MRQPTKTLCSISSRVVQQLGNYDGNTNDHQWKSVSEDEIEENHNEMMEDLSFTVAIHRFKELRNGAKQSKSSRYMQSF